MLLSNTLIRPFGYGWFRLYDDIMFLQDVWIFVIAAVTSAALFLSASFQIATLTTDRPRDCFGLALSAEDPAISGHVHHCVVLDKGFDACKHTVETTSTLGTDDTVRRVI